MTRNVELLRGAHHKPPKWRGANSGIALIKKLTCTVLSSSRTNEAYSLGSAKNTSVVLKYNCASRQKIQALKKSRLKQKAAG